MSSVCRTVSALKHGRCSLAYFSNFQRFPTFDHERLIINLKCFPTVVFSKLSGFPTMGTFVFQPCFFFYVALFFPTMPIFPTSG